MSERATRDERRRADSARGVYVEEAPGRERVGPPQDPATRAVERIDDAATELHRIGGVVTGAIEELVARELTPAILRTIVLTETRPLVTDDVGSGQFAQSVGLINPTAVTVYLGVGGSRAEPGRHSLSIPGNAAMVVPVSAEDLEVGAAAADLATGDAVVFLLRFASVQPLFFARL